MSGRGAPGPRGVVLAAACVLVAAVPARAQTDGGRYEFAAGFRATGPISLGRTDANETTPAGNPYRLFTADSRLAPLYAVEARAGVRLTPTIRVETAGSYGTSDFEVEAANDAEGIPDATAAVPVRQFRVDGSVLLDLARWRLGARATPFVSAGAGYLRGLFDGRILVDEAALWHVGVGLDIPLRVRPGARLDALGVRVDARALFRSGRGIFDGVHTSPSFGASAFVRF